MTQAAQPTFRCEVCAQSHAWSKDRVGESFTCRCGEPVTVPAEPEEDLYDLAPIPVAPIIETCGAASSVLAYQRPGAVAVDEKYSDANPLIVSAWRDLVLPISLILIGTAAQFSWDYHATGSAGSAMHSVGGYFLANIVIMLIGVMVAANVLGVTFGPVPTAILKLGAIAIGPVGFSILIGGLVGGGVFGFFLGMAFSLGFYFWLIWYLFELDTEDVWQTVIIIYGIRFVAGLIFMLV